jgi:hypothetical protein
MVVCMLPLVEGAFCTTGIYISAQLGQKLRDINQSLLHTDKLHKLKRQAVLGMAFMYAPPSQKCAYFAKKD